jgi:hypothetical protein
VVTDVGDEVLCIGDCAGFKASDADGALPYATMLAIGSRIPGEYAT